MRQSTTKLHAEVDLKKAQAKELQSLQNAYFRVSEPTFREVESLAQRLHKSTQNHKKRLPMFDREFVITNVDGPRKSGYRTVLITAPADGNHRLRIEMNYKNVLLLDRHFDLAPRRNYQIFFHLEDNELELLFPNEQPIHVPLDDFVFANHITSLRSSLSGRSTFVSCNQPRWKLRTTDEAPEYGLLTQFAYLSESHDLEDHLAVKISAESDGPPTAAADDPATVLHLNDYLSSGRKPNFRFENGRYIFDKTEVNPFQ